MSRWEKDLEDPFLAEAPDEGADALAGLVDPVTPPADLRARLLAGASLEGRFERFRATVAELLDVDEATASAMLDGIADPARWHDAPLPSVHLYDLEGGPAVANAITGFVRMPAGALFPEHEHLGDEAVLVVQGSFEDGVSGAIHRPGDVVRMSAHSAHSFLARPGPDLVYLVVVQDGVRIGDHVFGPDDPGL